MIENIAKNIAECFVHKNILESDDREICLYGLQIIISTCISVFLVLIISCFYGVVLQGIFYLFSYILLRSFAGGYHAKTHRQCILIFAMSYFVIVNFIMRFTNINDSIVLSVLVLCNINIILFAPDEANNNPISKWHKKKMKKNSIVVMFLLTFLVLLFRYAGGLEVAMFILMGSVLLNVLLLVGVLQKKITERRTYDEKIKKLYE